MIGLTVCFSRYRHYKSLFDQNLPLIFSLKNKLNALENHYREYQTGKLVYYRDLYPLVDSVLQTKKQNIAVTLTGNICLKCYDKFWLDLAEYSKRHKIVFFIVKENERSLKIMPQRNFEIVKIQKQYNDSINFMALQLIPPKKHESLVWFVDKNHLFYDRWVKLFDK